MGDQPLPIHLFCLGYRESHASFRGLDQHSLNPLHAFFRRESFGKSIQGTDNAYARKSVVNFDYCGWRISYQLTSLFVHSWIWYNDSIVKRYFFMDRSSCTLFFIVSILILGSVAMTYDRFFRVRDYMVQVQVNCDPYEEACFAYICDSSVDEGCTSSSLKDAFYYKLINRVARNVPLCEADLATCATLPCAINEMECFYTLCNTEMVEDSEVCTDPNTYRQLYPEAEENVDTETGMMSDEITFDESDSGGDEIEVDP